MYQAQLLFSAGSGEFVASPPNPAFDFGNKTRVTPTLHNCENRPYIFIYLGHLKEIALPLKSLSFLIYRVYISHLYGVSMRLEIIFAKHLAPSSFKELKKIFFKLILKCRGTNTRRTYTLSEASDGLGRFECILEPQGKALQVFFAKLKSVPP